MLQKNSIGLIEDNACDFLYFGSEAPSYLFGTRANDYYISGFSKIVGPGLRIGFIVANKDNIAELKSHKISLNLSSPILDQMLVAKCLQYEYLEQFRVEVKRKWQAFKMLLGKNGLSYQEPEGGIFVQAAINEAINLEQVMKLCKSRSVIVDENRYSYPDNKNRPFVRLNFVNNSEENNNKGLAILSEVITNEYKKIAGGH